VGMRHWRYSGEPARGAVLAEIIWSLPLFLSLLKERLETLPLVLVDVVHLTGKPRIGKVEVDFGTSSRSVPSVAADLIEVQTIVHQVGQHPRLHMPSPDAHDPAAGTLAAPSRSYWKGRFAPAFCSWSVRVEF